MEEYVTPLYLGVFPPLKGTLCATCASKFIEGAMKNLKKVKSHKKLSVIEKSMNNCFKEYLTLMNSWLAKVK